MEGWFHYLFSQRLRNAGRLFIHLEDRPVHPGAPLHVGIMNDCAPRNGNPDLLLGDLAQLPEQRFTDSELSECFLHIEVLELRTWSG